MTSIERWVERSLSSMSTMTREAFALDPLGTMRDTLDLHVSPVEELAAGREDGGSCDGVSYLSERVIFYAPTYNSKRENFTLAHEVGHWLVDQDEGILDWIADQDDAGLALETLCDRVAQRLLLPNDLIDNFVSHPIRARQVVDLYEGSAASRPVAAIAVASRLRAVGAVIIIDRSSGEVTSSSIQPDTEHGWPKVYPWRGERLPDGHFLASMEPEQALTRRSFWRAPWGARQDYFIDAIADERRIIAVLSGNDIWHVEAMPVLIDRAYDQRLVDTVFCCGEHLSVRGFPCSKCHQHFCPKCGNCRCTRVSASEQRCASCNCLSPVHVMTNGLCEMCA